MIGLILGRFPPAESRGPAVFLIFGAAMLLVRVWLAMPFWTSGLTKWLSFPTELSSSALYLFTNEFMLHLPGGPYPMPFPQVMAWLSGTGEIVLPILLVFGLLSRPAALGILVMTLVIQFTVPGGWPVHAQWALAGLAILVAGPGVFSLDWLVRRFGLERQAWQISS